MPLRGLLISWFSLPFGLSLPPHLSLYFAPPSLSLSRFRSRVPPHITLFRSWQKKVSREHVIYLLVVAQMAVRADSERGLGLLMLGYPRRPRRTNLRILGEPDEHSIRRPEIREMSRATGERGGPIFAQVSSLSNLKAKRKMIYSSKGETILTEGKDQQRNLGKVDIIKNFTQRVLNLESAKEKSMQTQEGPRRYRVLEVVAHNSLSPEGVPNGYTALG